MTRTPRVVAISIGLFVALSPLPASGVSEDLSVSGRVWQDTNADGRRTPGEPLLPDVVVYLFEGAAPVLPSERLAETTTDENGEFTFDGLAAGDHHLQFRLPDDAAFTYRDVGDDDETDSDADPGSGRTDAFTVDGSVSAVDAGLVNLPEFTIIGGWVWEDWDDDGIQDPPDEWPLGGVTVRLLRETPAPPRRGGRGGRRGGGSPTFEPFRTVTSHAFFGYAFYVPRGRTRYRVEVVPPDDYVTVAKDQGIDDDSDSDVDPGSRRTDPVDARADRELDIGLAPLSSIGDFAWVDADADGIQDPDEVGLPDVWVLLSRFDDEVGAFEVVDFEITDDAGSYAFDPRRPGRYQLQFVPPARHGFTLFQVGDDRSLDSDAMESSGRTPEILLPDDAIPPEEMAIRRFLAALAGIFAGLDRLRAADRAEDADAAIGGQVGGAAPFSLGAFLTAIWDAGFIPGTGLPEYTVSVDDGPVVCGTNRRVRDGEVTISGVRIIRLPNGDQLVLVRMARGLENDYSFAVVLHIRTPLGTISFIWEIHADDFRIGSFDPRTGAILQPVGEDLQIANLRDLGIVAFVIGAGLVPEDADLAAVQSFHSPNRRAMTRCHMTPSFEVPQP